MTKTSTLINVRSGSTSEIQLAVNRLVESVKALQDSYVTEEALEAFKAELFKGDTVPPVDPTDLVATKYENRNRLDWVNSTSSDTRATYIYRATEEGGDQTLIGQVAYPTNHFEDFNVQPKQSYWYYIQCVDDSDNLSNLVPDTDGDNVISGTELPAPSTLTADTWSQDDLNMSVDPVDGFGVSGYRWVIGSRRTEETTAPNYSYTITKNGEDGDLATSITVQVYALDEDGDPSEGYIEETFDHTAPSTVTGLAISRDTNDLGFKLTWTLSTNPCVIGYNVLVNGTVVESSYAGNEYLYKTSPKSGTYIFGVQAVNKFSQTSSLATNTIVVVGPGVVTNLKIKVLDNFANMSWTAPAIPSGGLPILEYEILKQDMAGTFVETLGRVASTYTSDVEYVPSTYKYYVAAVDIAGNMGSLVSATCEIESPNFELLTDVWEDFEDAEMTNILLREDGILLAPIDTTETFLEHFTNNGFTTVQDFIDAGYTYIFEPTPESASYSYELDYGAAINQATNIISTSDIDDHGATISHYIASKLLETDDYEDEENYTKLNSSSFQYVRTRLDIESEGMGFCYINTRRLQLSSKKRSESHSFAVTEAGTPCTVTFNSPFISIINISASLKYVEGSVGRVVEWDDGSGTPISSIDLYVFEGGAASTGDGTVTIEGY